MRHAYNTPITLQCIFKENNNFAKTVRSHSAGYKYLLNELVWVPSTPIFSSVIILHKLISPSFIWLTLLMSHAMLTFKPDYSYSRRGFGCQIKQKSSFMNPLIFAMHSCSIVDMSRLHQLNSCYSFSKCFTNLVSRALSYPS